MDELSRRKALLSAASIGTITVAGCLSETSLEPSSDDETGANPGTGNADENENDTDTDDESTDEEAGPEDPSGVLATSLETTGTDCGSPEDDDYGVDVALDENEEAVTITGTTPAPNPCHEAVLEAVRLGSGRLSLVIDVTSADEKGCIQCLGAVEYTARIDVDDGDAIAAVEVEHVEGDTYTVDEDQFGTGSEKLKIVSSAIETVATACRSGDDDRISVDPGDERLTLTGVLPSSTPCYEAVLEDVAIERTELSVIVDVQLTSEGERGCDDCVGQVEYEALFEVSNADRLDSVHVNHRTGGSHAAGWKSASESSHDNS